MITKKIKPAERDLLTVVNLAIKDAANVIKDGDIKKVKVPDLLKLVQLQKELGGEKPKAINVRWIETWESQPSSEV